VDTIVAWALGTAVLAAGAELAAVNRASPFVALLDMQATSINDLHEGLVRVVGRLARAPGALVESPVTGQGGLALHVRLCASSGRPLLPRGASDIKLATPFFVEGDGARVLVLASSSAEIVLRRTERATRQGYVRPDQYRDLRARLTPQLWDDRIAARTLGLRFRETLMTEGALVSVVGFASRAAHPAGEAAFPRSATELWQMEGAPHQPLVIARG